jgi:1,4-dihydroxy-2-naphthoyl-CoA hydrolase
MAIWYRKPTIENLRDRSKGTLVERIGIEFLEIGEDYIKAKMPVDKRTIQPYGILHGGASLVLAETLGSVAATLCVDTKKERCVGLEINANHVRSVSTGYVYGVTKPIHTGRTTHIWEIIICDPKDNLVCVSRLTLAVVKNES